MSLRTFPLIFWSHGLYPAGKWVVFTLAWWLPKASWERTVCDSCGVWAFRRRGTRLPEIQNFQIAFSSNVLSTVQLIFVTPVQLTLEWIKSEEYQRILSVELVAWFPYYSISCLPNTPPILEGRKALSGDFDMFFILSNDLSVLTWITKFYLGSIMCGEGSQSMLVHDAYRSPLTQSKWQGKENWRGISRVSQGDASSKRTCLPMQ